jgi:multiple sugar transport system ATP-binding protein
MDKETRATAAAKAIELVNLKGHEKKYPKQLSGGMKMRCSLARSLVLSPKVFLFDEPLSNLDAKLRVQMRHEIRRLHQRLGTTSVFVTHDQIEAMTMGQRIVVMKDGVIQQVAAPLEIYNEPANLFVAGFLGSPPMNFLKGTLRPEGDTHVFEEAGGPVRLALTHRKGLGAHTGKNITLGVRPEHCACIPQSGSLQANQFESTVENVEPMGAETFLYINTGAHQLVSRIPNAVDRAEAGHRLRFEIDFSTVHLFETESGTRLV